MYLRGESVAKNPDDAVKWFRQSAEQGNELAPGLLDKLETELTPKQIADAQKRAAEWHPVVH